MEKYKILSHMMFMPNNKERWSSYIKENFMPTREQSLDEAIEFIIRERDLIYGELGMDTETKADRLIPSIKTYLELNA